MKIRHIQPEERITASKIQSIAFTIGSDFSMSEMEPERFAKGYETGRALFNDEDKMCSCLELIPYSVNFNGNIVKMAGIGGVASLPEERRKGYIRELFRYSFNEMRNNGQLFSYLYPFSNVYYRKYGYESCLRKFKSTIPLTSFSHFHEFGEIKIYSGTEDDSSIKEIYNTFISDKNLSICRDEKLWNKHLGADPYKNNLYTYIWYNSEGKAKSYITFSAKIKDKFRADMEVQELIWLDDDSFLGILGFIKSFVPRYESFIWEHPEFLNLQMLFPEPYDVKTEASSSGMNRIVDLQEILKLIDFKGGKGEFSIDVKDAFLEWNNGCYIVKYDVDRVEVEKKERTNPDLLCSIQDLTQLITGYAGLEDYFWKKDFKVYSNQILLSKVFVKKKLYINDYF